MEGDRAVDAVRDSAGIEIVTAAGPGWSPEESWRLVPELDAGASDGPLAFGQVRDVAPRAAGGLWVLDPGAPAAVVAVGPDGRSGPAFGREGEGPGELRRPSSIAELRDGRIAVGTGFPPRLDWFDAAGAFLGATSFEPDGLPTGTGPAVATWALSPSGHGVVDLGAFPVPGGEGLSHALLALDPIEPGAEQATISSPRVLARWVVPLPNPLSDDPVYPLAPQLRWAVTPTGGIWSSEGTPYELRLTGADGVLRRIVRRPVAEIRIDAALRDRILAWLHHGVEGGPAADEIVDRTLARVRLPSVLPPVGRIWSSGPEGSVWVEALGPWSFEPRPTLRLDVFTPAGRYLGRLELPAGVTPRRLTSEALYGIREDESGVQHAVRYRIDRPVDLARGSG
jgi:hypothetical protein